MTLTISQGRLQARSFAKTSRKPRQLVGLTHNMQMRVRQTHAEKKACLLLIAGASVSFVGLFLNLTRFVLTETNVHQNKVVPKEAFMYMRGVFNTNR